MMTLEELRDAYIDTRRAHEAAQLVAKEADMKFRLAQSALAKAIRNNDLVDSVTGPDGLKMHVQTRRELTVTQKNSDGIRAWLRELLGDDKPYLKEVVSKPHVVELVNKVLEKKHPRDLPPCLGYREFDVISCKGWK